MASLRSLGHVSDYLDVPEFLQILSHGDKPAIHLFPGRPGVIVVLETRLQHFVVLSAVLEYGNAVWFDAIEQGRRLGMSFDGAYTCEDGILATLLQENVYEKEAVDARKKLRQDEEVFSKLVTDSSQIDWLKQIVGRAVSLQASDMHVEVRGEVGLLRVRLDGVMRKVTHFPARLVVQGFSAGYTLLAEEGSRSEVAFNALLPQSALIPLEIHDQQVLLRYQSHPTTAGFDVVIRILRVGQSEQDRLPMLERLGYTDWQRQTILEASESAWGGVFIAGVTGSGKTTTLSSLLRHLARGQRRKIIAIEDPVEYQIPGVSHLSIRRQSGDALRNPFEQAMLAFLRMDPDVGMFGEVRDTFSGQMAHAAIQTGHKLLTTVHATSALSIVGRLTSPQIGLQREDVCNTDFLSLLIYQSLVPLNCPHCAVHAEAEHPAELLRDYERLFGLDTAAMRAASREGCPACHVHGLEMAEEGHGGVKGVKVCAEVIPTDPEVLSYLRDGREMEARGYWLSKRTAAFDQPDMNGKEAWGHALYEVSQGRMDPFHFERCFGSPAILARSRALG